MARRPGHARPAFAPRPPPRVGRLSRPSGQPPIQLFGLRDSRTTQKALRFFKERRVEISFVDLARRPLAPGELRRFSERFSAAALADPASRPYRDSGLAHLSLDAEGWTARLLADPRLLRLPLVRAGSQLAVGDDEPGWRAMLAAG